MRTKNQNFIIALIIILVIVFYSSFFIVDQRKYAVVFQLGKVISVIDKPGLHFKIPLIQNVRQFDNRLLTIDTQDPERFITSEKKNVLVDYYVKWRIINPRLYYESVAGDEMRAATRLQQTVNAGLREEFGRGTVHDVVSGARDKIMEIVRDRADKDAGKIGVQILDVRLKRVDLPTEVSLSVYTRMESERKKAASELRSQGAGISEKIRADADKQREVILAEAYRDAEKLRGDGDAEATKIYSLAYTKDPEFYAFYRSLSAYRESFSGKQDILVLDTNSPFFKYFQQQP